MDHIKAAELSLQRALGGAANIPGLDGSPDHFMASSRVDAALAQADALISIADSLARIAAVMGVDHG